jgi:hypothetical protein
MNERIKYAVEEYQRRIDEVIKLEDALNLAEELMPDAQIWIDSEVNINFTAKSIDEVKDALRLFAHKCVMLKEFTKSDTNPTWTLRYGDVNIILQPRWTTGDDGASCKLVKVGEKTDTYPVYKLMCDGKEVES